MPRLKQTLTMLGIIAVCASAAPAADDNPAYLDAAAAGPDFRIQGEYEGKIGSNKKIGAQVIALGDGKFDAVIYGGGLPGGGWDPKQPKVLLTGETKSDLVEFEGQNFSGAIKGGTFAGVAEVSVQFSMRKVDRRSPTMGAKPPTGAVVLFDGSSADAWSGGEIMEDKLLGVGGRTTQKFSSYALHLEFRTPFMPESRGQGRANSGMYLNDQYECQILDSFGLSGENNECGGFYKIRKPDVNMCLPPLSWQTYDVDFTAAKFDAKGKKTAAAIVTIRHNGVVIHGDFKLPHNTPGGGINDESQPGSLFVQNHGNPVRFRNIWIAEK